MGEAVCMFAVRSCERVAALPPAVRKGSALPHGRLKIKLLGFSRLPESRRRCEKIVEKRNSLTQSRKVAKQTKEFWLSDLCALAPLRDGFSFFHSFAGFPSQQAAEPHRPVVSDFFTPS